MRETKAQLMKRLDTQARELLDLRQELARAVHKGEKLEGQRRECESERDELDRERVRTLTKWLEERNTKRSISAGAADIYSNLRDYEIQANLTLNALARLAEMCGVMHQADKTLKPHAELLLVMVRYAQDCLLDARHEQRDIRHSDETLKAIQQQLKWDADYPSEDDYEEGEIQ